MRPAPVAEATSHPPTVHTWSSQFLQLTQCNVEIWVVHGWGIIEAVVIWHWHRNLQFLLNPPYMGLVRSRHILLLPGHPEPLFFPHHDLTVDTELPVAGKPTHWVLGISSVCPAAVHQFFPEEYVLADVTWIPALGLRSLGHHSVIYRRVALPGSPR